MHPTGAHDRLGDVGCDVLRTNALDCRSEGTCVVHGNPLGVCYQGVGTIALAIEIETGNAGAVCMEPVVGTFTADHDLLVRAPHMVPVATRQLQGDINRV